MRNGNWTIYEPDRDTLEKYEKATRRCVRTKVAADKYAAAIEHLRTSSDTMKDVAAKFGLNLSSFRKYLYKHATDVLAMYWRCIGNKIEKR